MELGTSKDISRSRGFLCDSLLLGTLLATFTVQIEKCFISDVDNIVINVCMFFETIVYNYVRRRWTAKCLL